jgi:hypothetical protein
MNTGMSVGDGAKLRLDCIVHDGQQAPYLHYTNHKMRREAFVPIDTELAEAIATQQQAVIDEYDEPAFLLRAAPATPRQGRLQHRHVPRPNCTSGCASATSATNMAAHLNGLPPHIAQVICGHKTIDTTLGYKAVYPAEAIEAHRGFIARRRATRPSQEYRTPTDEEWDAFLAHFEKRIVSIGTCARAYATPCIHEHASLDVRSCAQARPSAAGWKRSATTSRPASPKPSAKDGSARSKDSKSASPAPTTSSTRSTPACNDKPPSRTSAYPRSPASPGAPHRNPPTDGLRDGTSQQPSPCDSATPHTHDPVRLVG